MPVVWKQLINSTKIIQKILKDNIKFKDKDKIVIPKIVNVFFFSNWQLVLYETEGLIFCLL